MNQNPVKTAGPNPGTLFFPCFFEKRRFGSMAFSTRYPQLTGHLAFGAQPTEDNSPGTSAAKRYESAGNHQTL
jgi:hypothetical protein